jgi:hypothetical protein
MVVDDLDLMRAPGVPPEADSPLLVDPNTVLSFSRALECLKAVVWRHSQVIDVCGSIQEPELSYSHPLHRLWEFPRQGPIEDLFGFFALEGPNHDYIVPPRVNTVKRYCRLGERLK